mgnify:CR=1 FL=1
MITQRVKQFQFKFSQDRSQTSGRDIISAQLFQLLIVSLLHSYTNKKMTGSNHFNEEQYG